MLLHVEPVHSVPTLVALTTIRYTKIASSFVRLKKQSTVCELLDMT